MNIIQEIIRCIMDLGVAFLYFIVILFCLYVIGKLIVSILDSGVDNRVDK